MEAGKVVILRPGGINAEQISEITGYIPQRAESSNQIEAPGMLKSHYAPTIPLYLGNIDELISRHAGKKIAVLSFSEERQDASIIFQKILSPTGNLHEAAKNLFNYLHLLEQSGAELIITELLPETGIGIAVNDRLIRASA
jgi:L-threonylcarbamoyladenylate synthase